MKDTVIEVLKSHFGADKDINESTLENGIIVRSIENETNDLFSMYYLFDMGNNNDKEMGVAIEYLPFLGTSKYSPAEIFASKGIKE